MAKAKQNKAGSKSLSQDVDMDMTPMIDCVFLLMIFFVLVIDLSQKDLEDLILPKSNYAPTDENPPDLRPIINVTQNGSVVWKKNFYYTPDQGKNLSGVDEMLARIKNELPDSEKEVQTIAGRQVEKVNTPVLIRADKWTEWHHVGKFMTSCSQPQAAFWKLELAMSEKDKEEPIRQGLGYQ